MEDMRSQDAKDLINSLVNLKLKYGDMFEVYVEAYLKLCKQHGRLQRELISLGRKYEELSLADPELSGISDALWHIADNLPEVYECRRR